MRGQASELQGQVGPPILIRRLSNHNNPMNTETRDTNPDPITGEPGSHPVGTGLGAAGGAATGAAIGAVGGPIGAVIGGSVGAVLGGLAGKGVAEGIDPTAEDAYWRENYNKESYVAPDHSYDDYAPAYRAGYSSYNRGGRFEDRESDLERNWENVKGQSRLKWEQAKHATRAAWDRVERAIPGDSDRDGK